MAMFELNNSIKFLIPTGFNFSKDINKDGKEYLRLLPIILNLLLKLPLV